MTTGTLGTFLLNFSGMLICSELVVPEKAGGVGGKGIIVFHQCYQNVTFMR